MKTWRSTHPDGRPKVETDVEKTCCICSKTFTEWGNNPAPVRTNGTCCDDCNEAHVLRARVEGMRT